MTNFLSLETIKAAVERLGQSRANSSLVDYLIFKRALVLANEEAQVPGTVTQVKTGVRSPHFVSAVNKLTRIDEEGSSQTPYYSPFGAWRDSGKGYKSQKFPSNGPSVTVSGWSARPDPPLQVVDDTKPKEFQIAEPNSGALRRFFLVEENVTTKAKLKPHLGDLAIWWKRSQSFDSEVDISRLVEQTVEDLNLTAIEIATLFEADTLPANVRITFSELPALAQGYLPPPPLKEQTAVVPENAVHLEKVVATDVDMIKEYAASKGFAFEPWQIAAFVTAVRTKPFIILAGISGTGKTKLPRVVAEATGAEFRRLPVRPDWTDSSALLGYENLTGNFIPGYLLQIAREAIENGDKQYFLLLDEMNIARVEYYLAEVLSHLEDRIVGEDGKWRSEALVPEASDSEWKDVHLPSNLCIVGSVNMDETTFGFSRKVLDRSFVLEFMSVSLPLQEESTMVAQSQVWDISKWIPPSINLPQHPDRSNPVVGQTIEILERLNGILTPVQLQIGYRVRDEIAMFVLAAIHCQESFMYDAEIPVSALDIAVASKILPRIQGGGTPIQEVLEKLAAWADPEETEMNSDEESVHGFPFCARRIQLMIDRLDQTGFASYWL